MRSDEFYLSVFDVDICDAIFIRNDITQIANHALFIVRRTVVSAERIENTTGSYKAFRKITKHMYMNAVLTLKVKEMNDME